MLSYTGSYVLCRWACGWGWAQSLNMPIFASKIVPCIRCFSIVFVLSSFNCLSSVRTYLENIVSASSGNCWGTLVFVITSAIDFSIDNSCSSFCLFSRFLFLVGRLVLTTELLTLSQSEQTAWASSGESVLSSSLSEASSAGA